LIYFKDRPRCFAFYPVSEQIIGRKAMNVNWLKGFVGFSMLAGLASGEAIAQIPPTPRHTLVVARDLAEKAQVEAVDVPNRTVTLKLSDGTTERFAVEPGIRDLDMVRKDDTLVIVAEQRLTFQVYGPGVAPPPDRTNAGGARVERGQLPAGVVADETTGSFRVVSVNLPTNQISVVPATGGSVVTVTAKDAERAAALKQVRAGDLLTVTESRFIAMRIDRGKK
jgi:hypothetical protein